MYMHALVNHAKNDFEQEYMLRGINYCCTDKTLHVGLRPRLTYCPYTHNILYTVEPLCSGHLWEMKIWPLYRGVALT